MYVWVRPDKFPIREAFAEPFEPLLYEERSKPSPLTDLPIDVLLVIAHHSSLVDVVSLLAVCTSLRAKLLNCMDAIAKQHLTWAVPAAFGEQNRWDAMLGDAGASSEPFPWLAYARQCHLSPSMRNRERIWGICMQLEQLAISHGVV